MTDEGQSTPDPNPKGAEGSALRAAGRVTTGSRLPRHDAEPRSRTRNRALRARGLEWT
jgi:hypothetical protein